MSIFQSKGFSTVSTAGFTGKSGIWRIKAKGPKSQWCESLQKRRTTPLLSGNAVLGRFRKTVLNLNLVLPSFTAYVYISWAAIAEQVYRSSRLISLGSQVRV